MESMKAVALAAKARSLADFQKAVKAYKVRSTHRSTFPQCEKIKCSILKYFVPRKMSLYYELSNWFLG